jgi:hypothetical protein
MFGFIERIVIPSLVIFVLLGGLAGTLLGAALVWRSAAALRFVARMNRWVSTRRALSALEMPHGGHGVPAGLRRWLGAFLALGGALSMVLLLVRLQVLQRGSYVPGVDMERWLVSGVAVQTMKWVLVAGGALAFAVGVLMLFLPARLAAFEARMDHWYSSPRLLQAEERMIMPLEPRVEANPRAAGWLIGGASLLVAVAMVVLLFAKLR